MKGLRWNRLVSRGYQHGSAWQRWNHGLQLKGTHRWVWWMDWTGRHHMSHCSEVQAETVGDSPLTHRTSEVVGINQSKKKKKKRNQSAWVLVLEVRQMVGGGDAGGRSILQAVRRWEIQIAFGWIFLTPQHHHRQLFAGRCYTLSPCLNAVRSNVSFQTLAARVWNRNA